MFFFFKQKTAYDMRISDWSSDVCSSDLRDAGAVARCHRPAQRDRRRPGRLGPSPKMGTGADRQALAAARLISWLAYSDGSSRRRSQHQECQMVLRQEGREEEIGRAHVCTPVTNAHLVCRLLLEKKKNKEQK